MGIGGMDLGGLKSWMPGQKEEASQRYIGTGDPLSDPLMAALTEQTMLGMGQVPDAATAARAGPFNQALSRFLNSHALDRSDQVEFFQRAQSVLAKVEAGEELLPVDMGFLDMVAPLIGMTSDQLMQSQMDYTSQQQGRADQYQQLAELNEQGRFGAQEQLAFLMGNLPDVSMEGFESYRMDEKDRIIRELNRSVDEASGGALRQANFANYNPGRVLGDLEEARIRGTQDADLASLEYALGALSGQQNLSVSRAQQLQGYIAAPTQQAAQLAGIRATGLFQPTQMFAQQIIPSKLQRAATEFKTVAEGMESMTSAAGNVGAMGACWCAAVYYPRSTQQWLDSRRWILDGWSSPVGRNFKRLYLRYGERASHLLLRNRWLREAARPLFKWIHRKGAEYRWQMS